MRPLREGPTGLERPGLFHLLRAAPTPRPRSTETGNQVLRNSLVVDFERPEYFPTLNEIVKGKINFISNISTDSGYLAKVILPQGLNTNYNRQIQYKDGLLAQGEIITKDMRLLQRFYQNIIQQIKYISP